MKVVFLDFDGVLNHSRWPGMKMKDASSDFTWWASMIDPKCVHHLNKIVEETDAQIVVSSTWRMRNSLEFLQEILDSFGFVGKIIDRTPFHNETKIQREDGTWSGPKMSLYPTRGQEITWWLHNHPEVSNFVILDDNSDMSHLMPYLVQSRWSPLGELSHPWGAIASEKEVIISDKDEEETEGLGLTEELANKAIKILNEGI